MTNTQIHVATGMSHTEGTGADSMVVRQRLRPVMGTLCAIEAHGPVDAIRAGIPAAFAVMTQIEERMHPARATSDVARLNGSTHARIKIDAATWEVLAMAHRLHALSNGLFDPCLPSRPGCLRDVELLSDSTAVCHAPVAIDLGGIAKGYAIDQAINALRHAGCISGLVNAGGDVKVFGAQPQQILIRVQQQTVSIALLDSALAVSEVAAANRPAEHQGYYLRTIDQVPARNQVAVIAEHAMTADALTKCAMFCTDAAINAMFERLNATQIFVGT